MENENQLELEQMKCVKECTKFIEKLFLTKSVENRRFRVKLKDECISLYTPTNWWFNFYNSYDFKLYNGSIVKSLYDESIRVDWFCRRKYIKLNMIEEIWLENIPLYYKGKAQFKCEDNYQLSILFHLPWKSCEDFNEEKITHQDLKDKINLIIKRNN